MAAGNPFVPQAPQVQDPVQQYARVMQLKSLGQQQELGSQQIQAGQMQLQEQQMRLQDQQELSRAWHDSGGDLNEYQNKLLSPAYNISPAGRQQSLSTIFATRQEAYKLKGEQFDFAKKQADALNQAYDEISQAPEEKRPAAYARKMFELQNEGVDVSHLPPTYNPQAFQAFQQPLKTTAQILDEHAKNLKAVPPGGSLVDISSGKPLYSAPPKETVESMELADFLKRNPGKGPSDFAAWKAQIGRDPNAASDRQFREGQQSYQYSSNALDKVGQPIEQLVQRVGRLKDTLAQATPQSDALVAPELLTVMAGGMGSGLRMNEAEISRIVGGRNKWQSLKSTIDAWQTDPSKPFLITPAQRSQVNALIDEVNRKLQAKQQILDDARQDLASSNDPMGHRQILTKARNRLMQVDQGQAGGGSQLSPAAQAFISKYSK